MAIRGPNSSGQPAPAGKGLALLNEAIKAARVRLIADGVNEVIPRAEALRRARELNMDLVQVADADPIVCKIMDYHRETYKKKVDMKARVVKKVVMGQMKEIKMKGLIEAHDLSTKCNKISEALEKYHPVRVIVQSNAKMLRVKADCLLTLPTAILESLKEKNVTYILHSRSIEKANAEMVLMPKMPSASQGGGSNSTS
jgi:translation initiation factor IF-3